jgi:hypothetical protein
MHLFNLPLHKLSEQIFVSLPINRNMRNLKLIFTGIILTSAILAGCRKSGDKASWDIDAIAPLFYSELTINNLIPDSLLSTDADGFVSLAYADTIIQLALDTLIKLPDTTIVEAFSLPFGSISVPPGTIFTSIPDEIEINAEDVELRNAIVKEGTIIIKVTSNVPGAVVTKYEIPNATLNGVPFMAEALVPGITGNTPGTIIQSFDVSGYALDFTQGVTSPFNRLRTLLTLGSDPNGETITLNATHSVTIETTFSGFKPKFATGYFGNQYYEVGPETSAINAFDLIESGTIDVDQVQFNLIIRNGVGVDIRANISQLSSVNQASFNSIDLQHSIIGSPINLNRATMQNGEIIYSSYPVMLNQNNSNIDLMLENLPSHFNYSANLQLNPLGNISNHHDFVDCTSTFDVVLDATIPLSIIANQLQLGDTSTISLGNNSVLDNVNYGTLVIRMNNGFPLEGWLDFELLKSNEPALLLLNNAYFSSAPLNINNEVIAPVFHEFRINLTNEDIASLKSSDKLVARVRFNTASLTEHIRIYNHHRMTLKAIGDFNYHVETN